MSEWYKDWFESSEYLSLYRHRDDAEAKKILDLLRSRLILNPATSILDVACGAGRHSVVFAENGFKVTGFDISRNLLKVARGKACSAGKSVLLYCADIRNFATKRKYEVILNLFTSFGYFDNDEENFALFENVYNHLTKPGYFVFDYFNVHFLKKNLIPESVNIIEGKRIVQRRYFTENQRVNKDIFITDSIGKKHYQETVRLYEKDEIVERLKNTGFNIHTLLGSYEGTAFEKESSQRLIIIAGK